MAMPQLYFYQYLIFKLVSLIIFVFLHRFYNHPGCTAARDKKNKTHNEPRNMKKEIPLLFLLCVLTFTASAQLESPTIRFQATSTPARCQADGAICCSLLDTAGLGLEQIRYSYIPLTGIDSIVETSLACVSHLRPGNYKIIVSALCPTGLPGEDAYTVLSDTLEEIVVTSDYVVPGNGMLYNIFSAAMPYGIVPALPCRPTGKAQVKIEGGTFPYTLDIWSISGTDTLFLKTVTFNSHQHQGDDPLRYDFRDYYTIDSLPQGAYKILCHDGCNYYMPALFFSVPKVKYGIYDESFLLRNSSGIPESRNIVTFKRSALKTEFVRHTDDYYRLLAPQDMPFSYRFINPTYSEAQDTTLWKTFPDNSSAALFFHDTVAGVSDYGGLYFKRIILQVKPPCEDTLFSFPFVIYPQASNFGSISRRYENIQSSSWEYLQCGYLVGENSYKLVACGITCWHATNDCLAEDSIGCKTPQGYSRTDSVIGRLWEEDRHSYITFPLKYLAVNISADSVISSGILSGTNYNWFHTLLDSIELDGDTVAIEITDAGDLPLLTTLVKYVKLTHVRTSAYYRRYVWNAREEESDTLCPGSAHSIGVFQRYGAEGRLYGSSQLRYSYEGDTVRLIGSPDGDKYNFTAYFEQDTLRVFKERADNHARISRHTFKVDKYYLYPGVLLTDTNLAYGTYTWEISHACDSIDTLVFERVSPLPEIEEPAEYRFDTSCTQLKIIPVKGALRLEGAPAETYFQIFPDDRCHHTPSAARLGDTLSAGVPGLYRIGMYALPKGKASMLPYNPCFVTDTVIEWGGNTIELDYLYGHICSEDDHTGFVRAKGKNGLRPYLYTLYDAPGGTGVILGTNSTGIFDNVPLRYAQRVSVEMTDCCQAHFISDLTIGNMEKVRKGWTNRELNEVTLGISDTFRLYGLSLGDVSYHWHGPNGFSVFAQNAVLPLDGLGCAGTYYIDIDGAGCGTLRDSIVLHVVDHPCPDAIDFDGNIYAAARIDGLCWTKKNLRSIHYSDGRPIPNPSAYLSELFNETEIVSIFGMLYDWNSAADTAGGGIRLPSGHIQGACPEGWYLPKPAQYESLALHGAAALRSGQYWINGSGGHNSTGFSALPSGFYNGATRRYENLLGEAYFWSAEGMGDSSIPYLHYLSYYCEELSNRAMPVGNSYSIRCILNERNRQK